MTASEEPLAGVRPGWCSWLDDDTGEDDPVAWLSSMASAEITISAEMGDQ